MNKLLSLSKAGILICAASGLAHPQQLPANTASSAKVLEVEVTTDKVQYRIGEPIRFTALLVNRGSSPVYIAKNFFASGGGIAGFSLSVKQTEGKSSAECPLDVDRFDDSAGPRSAKQILREDFLWLAAGGIVGYTGKYEGCAVKHEGSYELTVTYCPCDLNTGTAQSAAKQEGTHIITKSNAMTGFTTNVLLYRNRVPSRGAFEGLELCEGKLSCTVLRGLGDRKVVRLLGA